MVRSVRVFLVGLLFGIVATLAVTQEKITFAQTDEGFAVTCKTRLFEGKCALPGQITDLVKQRLPQ